MKLLLAWLCLLPFAFGQGTHADLRIDKIDPPNWWVQMPAPMLLLHGQGLAEARFALSDPALRIERATPSANGHYVQLWLNTAPAQPETVQIAATSRTGQTLTHPFTFAARRPATDGFAGFSGSDVMYLILTDRFADGDKTNDGPLAHDSADSPGAAAERAKPRGWHGGDLRGIAEHLDYLQSLGVTTVWPTPVYQNHSADAYHGYHATDYYAVDEHYGSMAELQGLVKALHARGMKLVLDTVPNHVGPFHPWVEDEPTPEWFHGTREHHLKDETNFPALINPHAPERDRVATLKGWFVDLLPDMNTDDPAVAQYLRQNAVWWLEETAADGLRIDTFPYVDRPFWHAFTAELKALYPHVTEVGEVSNGDPEITSAFADGVTRAGVDTGLYTPFDFPFYHAVRDVFANDAPMTRLTRVLESDELYPHPERLVPFVGNHDESRLAQDVHDPALRRLANTLLLTTRGTPQLYAGDEIDMAGGNDPDNRRDFPAAAFAAAGRSAEQQAMFAPVQSLLKLRAAHVALQTGREQILSAGKDVLVYLRSEGGERICVALNRSGAAQTQEIEMTDTDAAGRTGLKVLTGIAGAASLSGSTMHLRLPPASATVFQLE